MRKWFNSGKPVYHSDLRTSPTIRGSVKFRVVNIITEAGIPVSPFHCDLRRPVITRTMGCTKQKGEFLAPLLIDMQSHLPTGEKNIVLSLDLIQALEQNIKGICELYARVEPYGPSPGKNFFR